jgi:hypothetical protein
MEIRKIIQIIISSGKEKGRLDINVTKELKVFVMKTIKH